MDASEECLEDRINLKIEIKEENGILLSISPETVLVNDELGSTDLNIMKSEPDSQDVVDESNYFVTDKELQNMPDIKTESYQMKFNAKNETAWELLKDEGWEENVKGKIKHIGDDHAIGNLYNIKHEDVEIKSEENFSANSSHSLKDEPDNCANTKTKRDGSKGKGIKHRSISKKQMYECDSFDYKIIFKQYLWKRHLKERVYKCESCDYKSISRSSLTRHQLKHKDIPEDKMYKCDLCDYKSIFKSYVTKHLRKHTDQMFKCDSCDFKTVYKDYLKKHQLKHAEEMFECDLCDYKTNFKHSLTRHRVRHKDIPEDQMYKCDLCDYKAIYKSCVTKHQLKHTEKMFECDLCDYKTNYKKDIVQHQIRHKNIPEDEMYKCDSCEFKTIYKSYETSTET